MLPPRDIIIKFLPRSICRFVVAMLVVLSLFISFPNNAKAYTYNCAVPGSPFETHYGIFNGPIPKDDSTAPANICIDCWYWLCGPGWCICTDPPLIHSWLKDYPNCTAADITNPVTVCTTGNYKPIVSRIGDISVSSQPPDTYYRDLCINGGQLGVDDFDPDTGMPISVGGVAFTATDTSTLYGTKVVGLVNGAKPARGTCMSAVNTPKSTPHVATNKNAAYGAYKNANNVDFVSKGDEPEGANSGEYKKGYGDSQNLYKSAASFLADASCPSDIGGSPTTADGWKTKAALCYDYYILNRATHPEWTLERAGKSSNDPLTATSPNHAIFNNCQPLMNGTDAKNVIAGASPFVKGFTNGFAPVLQYTNRPDLDEAEYNPSAYLTTAWNNRFLGKPAPIFQNLFPCVKTDNSSVMTVDWPLFNLIVSDGYAIIYGIEKDVLNYDKGLNYGFVRSDYNYSSVGLGNANFCPNVEKINNPAHPFSPRDDLYNKKPIYLSANFPVLGQVTVPLEMPDLTFQQNYSTDRGYSWETSGLVFKERVQNGTAWGYTDFSNPTSKANPQKLMDMVKHPEVMCAVVPVDILAPRREAFNNCIMQRIEYNYFSWRFNNFVDYYGIKNKNWTPPCKTRFYENDSASDCPVKMSIQQCCRIIVKDVVPMNYLKMRTCEGLRQKRNLILGYDHIYDGAGTSVGGKPVKVTDQASYDKVALLNQKLSLIGCDNTEPGSYGFQNYFKPDVNLGVIPTDIISTGIDTISSTATTVIKNARSTADTAVNSAAAAAWAQVAATQTAESQAVLAMNNITSMAKGVMTTADNTLQMAQSSLDVAQAALKANPTSASAATAVQTATTQLQTAQDTRDMVQKAQTSAYSAASQAQDTYNQAMTQAQGIARSSVSQIMDSIENGISNIATMISDKFSQAFDKLKSSDAVQAISDIYNNASSIVGAVSSGNVTQQNINSVTSSAKNIAGSVGAVQSGVASATSSVTSALGSFGSATSSASGAAQQVSGLSAGSIKIPAADLANVQSLLDKANTTLASDATNAAALEMKQFANSFMGVAQAGQAVTGQALSQIQDKLKQATSAAQDAMKQAQDQVSKVLDKVQSQATDKLTQGVSAIQDKTADTASKAIDTLLNSMGNNGEYATLIEGGSHMPYMRWWDTGVSAGNTTHGGSFVNTMGSYDVIIGVGREERDYFDAKDTDVKKRLDADKQLPTQTSQMGRISGWEGLKGHQMWTTRLNALSCIGRYEKLFKPQGAENFVLSRAGTQYFNKQANYLSGIKPATEDGSGRPWPWPLGWRGYVNDPNNDFEANITTTGLSNAQKGDIVIFTLNNVKQIAFVADTSSATNPTSVKVESWDQGKFPTAAGVSISAGNVMTRTIYQTSVPPDDQQLIANSSDAALIGGNPSCEDPNYTGCVLPAGVWDSAEIYRPSADSSRLCPVDTTISESQTSHFDTNSFAYCVNAGYDPPSSMRRNYSGTGTGTQQNNTPCGAKWGSCTTSATTTNCFPSGANCTATAP